MDLKIPVLTGQTASGKTELTRKLIDRFPELVVVSADSRKIYIHMDVGTAKPTYPYRCNYRMLDVVEPNQRFNAFMYLQQAEREIEQALKSGRRVIVEGGTVFYIKALTQGLSVFPSIPEELLHELESKDTKELYDMLRKLDSERASEIHPNDRFRIVRSLSVVLISGRKFKQVAKENFRKPRFKYEIFVLEVSPIELEESIENRLYNMLVDGLLDEVRKLVGMYGYEAHALRNTIDYKEFLPYLKRKVSLRQAIEDALRNTKDFARRQKTFLKQFDARRGDRETILRLLSSSLENLYKG